MDFVNKKAVVFAVLAAALYALNPPVSKLLLVDVSPTMLAGLLYLGAGLGLFVVGRVQKRLGKNTGEIALTKQDLPYTVGMVLLDIAAPICLMLGLTMTTAANASLLNNFEIVTTSLIALLVFKENISKRVWVGIALVTLSTMILSFEDFESLKFSWGSLLVLVACVCWGFENNCTRMLSAKNPLQIVVIKGFGSGMGSLLIALFIGEFSCGFIYLIIALLLGFVSYGLSIFLYIYAQRYLGAAKTSTYYAVAPFIGVVMSLLIFREIPQVSFFVALFIMIIGTYYVSTDNS